MNTSFKERCFSKYLELYIKDPKKKITISSLCTSLNISRQRFYNVFDYEDNFKKALIQYIATISFKDVDSIEALENSVISQIEFYFNNVSIIKTFDNNSEDLTTFIKQIDAILINNHNLNLSKEQIDFIVGGLVKIIYDIRFHDIFITEDILKRYRTIIHLILLEKM